MTCQENVEALRQSIDAFNRRDLDAAVAGFHPDIEWEPGAASPEANLYRGHTGVRRFWDTWFDTMDNFRIEITDGLDAGDDRVLLLTRAVGTGKGSGVPVEAELFQLFEFRDGKAVRARMFGDRSDAFDAAGLQQ